MGHVVAFGELLLRLTAPGRELLVQNGRLDIHVGGAEANVAVGLARLGHQTAMVSVVPDNALGDSAAGHLRRYGVDTSGVATGRGGWASISCRRGRGYGHRTSSTTARAAHSRWPGRMRSNGTGCSTAPTSSIFPASPRRLAAIRPTPPLRPPRPPKRKASWSRSTAISAHSSGRAGTVIPRRFAELVGHSDILFGNHRDISLLLGREFSGQGEFRRREAAEAALERFPGLKHIASTARHVTDADTHRIAARIDGREGSAQTGDMVVAGIVDQIGAGDAFAAGVLHGMRSGLELDATVQAGLALTCLKHSLPGDASLFSKRDIEAFVAGERDVRR